MTMFDVNLLFDYWKDNPPLDVIVKTIAVWAGAYKPTETTAKQIHAPVSNNTTKEDLTALFKGMNLEAVSKQLMNMPGMAI